MIQGNLFSKHPPPSAVIEQARNKVFEEAKDCGGKCPVCDQFVKVYRRKVTSSMARQLIYSYNSFGHRSFHIGSFRVPVTDWAVLMHFGLIEPSAHTEGEDGKKHSGYWRITMLGARFIQRITKVKKYALIYNQKFLAFDGNEETDIIESLSNKFDYLELMEGF